MNSIDEQISTTEKIADVGNGVSDLGDYPSRTIGNIITGTLADIGKAAIKTQHPDIDYGELSPDAMTKIGKVITSEVLTGSEKQ